MADKDLLFELLFCLSYPHRRGYSLPVVLFFSAQALLPSHIHFNDRQNKRTREAYLSSLRQRYSSRSIMLSLLKASKRQPRRSQLSKLHLPVKYLTVSDGGWSFSFNHQSVTGIITSLKPTTLRRSQSRGQIYLYPHLPTGRPNNYCLRQFPFLVLLTLFLV